MEVHTTYKMDCMLSSPFLLLSESSGELQEMALHNSVALFTQSFSLKPEL